MMAGNWQQGKKTIQIKLRACVRLIARLTEMKICFGNLDDNEVFWVSVIAVSLRPANTQAQNSSAGHTYELEITICSNWLVWICRQFLESQYDVTTF